MNLFKNSFNLLVIFLVLGLSASVRSQDDPDSDDAALAAAAEAAAADSSSSGSDAGADIDRTLDIVESAFGSTSDAVGSSSGSDSRLNDIPPAVAAAPVAATRPGIPRLGSGYLLEQFRNFNLPGRIRGWTERIRNLQLRERARQFRAGLVINPDSLAYRTGRRFTLTLQGLAKRVRDWGERVRARQGASQNEISRR